MTDTDPLGGIPSVGKKCLVSEHNVTFYCCLNEDILPVPEKVSQQVGTSLFINLEKFLWDRQQQDLGTWTNPEGGLE